MRFLSSSVTAHPTVQRTSWETLPEVELATAEWVDWFNHRRVHGEIGYVPPTEYEATQSQQNKRPRIAVAAWVSIKPGMVQGACSVRLFGGSRACEGGCSGWAADALPSGSFGRGRCVGCRTLAGCV
ncbi:hypothetical protein C5746_41115 [Streptomyces atratus]|uniref:Integrase catalytic domain-containing protein n=1 Tax=Streptomyces atratus TaxID=1893 RepID=A0A2Z5JPB1_STRAR|nr:hypothetical protein C5746_41115 [Streptomyces atratus]